MSTKNWGKVPSEEKLAKVKGERVRGTFEGKISESKRRESERFAEIDED